MASQKGFGICTTALQSRFADDDGGGLDERTPVAGLRLSLMHQVVTGQRSPALSVSLGILRQLLA